MSKKPEITVDPGYVRQAIVTCFHAPTNTRGSRISATCQAGRIYTSAGWSPDGPEAEHHAACLAMATKMGWTGRWAGGARVDARGNVYVNVVPEKKGRKR